MAAEDAADGEPCTFEGAVLAQRLDGILRARRRVAACGGEVGRYRPLIESYQQDQQGFQPQGFRF